MRLHVLVRPDPDESSRVTRAQIDAGQEWLEARERSGLFEWVEPFRRTGGFVIAIAPCDDEADAIAWFEELWQDYPLRETISWEVDALFDTPDVKRRLREGFDVLRDAHGRGVPTAEVADERERIMT
jgi:GNAT superfamily N-acetyltransferase